MDRKYWQIYGRKTTPEYHLLDFANILELVRRSELTSSGPSVEAVIGIAVAGFAVIFGLLVALGCWCARRRYPKRSRAPDLDDENTNVVESLSWNPPAAAIALGRERPFPYFSQQSLANSAARLSKDRKNEQRDTFSSFTSQLQSPSSGFRISGLRDSWPLNSWSLSTPPKTGIQSRESPKRANLTRLTYSMRNSSQGYHSRPPLGGLIQYPEIIVDIGPAIKSTHSGKGSVSSRGSLLKRRSVSDNHLTTILRSTSQRLRDAKRGRLSRAATVMSYPTGPPPNIEPPSLLRRDSNDSADNIVDHDESSNYAESVKSSILAISSPKTSSGRISTTHDDVYSDQRALTPDSDDDSICGMQPIEMVTPVGLTSPSKKRRTPERYKVQIRSQGISPTQLPEDNRAMAVAFGGDNTFSHNEYWKNSSSNNDPFVSAVSIVRQKSEPQLHRKSTLGPHNSDANNFQMPLPLRKASGNSQALVKDTIVITRLQTNPFQWSPKDAVTASGFPKSAGIRKKGHKRSQTVRMSVIQCSSKSNVSIVHEEPEHEASTKTSILALQVPALRVCSPGLTTSSPTPVKVQSGNIRPPSSSKFQPFLCVPSTQDSADLINCTYQASYPLSVYDYYSNADLSKAGVNIPPDLSSSNATKRLCQNFSVESIARFPVRDANRRISLSATTTPHLPPPCDSSISTSSELLQSSPPTISPLRGNAYFGSELKRVATLPPRLSGPRAQPEPMSRSPGRTSLANSVNLLRRMNSQLSHYAPISTSSSPSLLRSPNIPSIPPLPKELLEASRRQSFSLQHAQSNFTPNLNSLSESSSPRRNASQRGRSPQRQSSRRSVQIKSPIPEEIKSSPPSYTPISDLNLNSKKTSFSSPPASNNGASIKIHHHNKTAVQSLPGRYDLAHNAARDSQDSIASSISLGMGLGLRLTGDGSPRTGMGRRRKDSLWGAESVRGSTLPLPPTPCLPELEKLPKSPGVPLTTGTPRQEKRNKSPESGNRVKQSLPGRPRKKGPVRPSSTPQRARHQAEGSISKAPGSDIRIGMERTTSSPAPVWGEKWRRSLGLYDEDGFLRSSPGTTGSSPIKVAAYGDTNARLGYNMA